jgi:hypothetical protein
MVQIYITNYTKYFGDFAPFSGNLYIGLLKLLVIKIAGPSGRAL